MHYQNQRSRDVALKALECLQELQGAKGSEVDHEVKTSFSSSSSSFASSTVKPSKSNNPGPEKKFSRPNQLRVQRNCHQILKFTAHEDQFLKKGIAKLELGQWTAILSDADYTFHEGSVADSLKKREVCLE